MIYVTEINSLMVSNNTNIYSSSSTQILIAQVYS